MARRIFGVRADELLSTINDGVLAFPGLRFFLDPDSGIRRIGANNWALVKGGVDVLVMETNGDLTVPVGNLVMGTAGKGIDFSATADATGQSSELFDDYEEGIYTPTITCSISGSYTLNTSFDTLAYTKVGRVVHVQGEIRVSSESSPSGTLQLSLPFAVAALTENADFTFGGLTIVNHGDAGIENAFLNAIAGGSVAQFVNITDVGGVENIDHDRVDTAFEVRISLTYLAAT